MSHFAVLSLLYALLFGFVVSDAILADETILCDKKFKIVRKANGKEFGQYALKAYVDATNNIVIEERNRHAYGEKTVGVESKIIYQGTEPFWPLSAETKCTLDDKVFMEGKVTFKGYFIDLHATGKFDFISGEKFDPPKTHVWDNEPGPGQIILFQPALAFIGPKLLPEQGKRNDLSFADFPDDVFVDELIEFNKSEQIVRSKPDENGHYTIAMLANNKVDIELEVTLDRDSKLVSMQTNGIKFVEITEK